MLSNRERLIALNLIPGIGSVRLRRLLNQYGDAGRVSRATTQELLNIEGIGPHIARQIRSGVRAEGLVQEEMAFARHKGVRIVTLEDAGYPNALRDIPDPPLVLYIRGRLPPAEKSAVAVVGSRRASLYGVATAQRLGYDLAAWGLTVVSGMARGIDAAAHRGALRATGKTVAVCGCGLARVYPPEHAALAREIAVQGALISEYPMRMAPLAENFPRRNRLISGLSRGVVVVEASSRSGALITADCALEQGREVFAVPGPVTTPTSQGSHQLLKDGACLVTSAADVMDELGIVAVRTVPGYSRKPATVLPEAQQRVLACTPDTAPRHLDEIASDLGWPVREVSAALVRLELQRFVEVLPGQRFIRRST